MHSPAISGPPPKSRIIGLDEVKVHTNYSKSKIYRDMRTGKFPPQAEKLEGSTSAGWFEDDIDAFLEGLRPESSEPGSGALPKIARTGEIANPDIHHTDRSKLNPIVLATAKVFQTKGVGKTKRLFAPG